MSLHPHYLAELILTVVSFLLAIWAAFLLRKVPQRRLGWAVLAVLVFLSAWSAFLAPVRFARLFSAPFVTWMRCLGLFATVAIVYASVMTAALRFTGAFRPERRRLLRITGTAAVAAPAALSGFAILKRDDLQLREVDIRLPSIPKDLDGLRIVQLSDIHLSPFVPESLLARAVGMANETKADIALVTGDLITMKGDPLDACLRQLRGLRAELGSFGCMGNHEIYAGSQRYTQTESARFGLRFLRQESATLLVGSTPLVLTGVDYQRNKEAHLTGIDPLVRPGAFNVLLSHNPAVFPTAAEKNFDLTIAGHTHGGQVTFEMIHPALNVVNFTSDFVYGVYERNGRGLYVTRGIGTIGVPARLGAKPEVALLRLCAT